MRALSSGARPSARRPAPSSARARPFCTKVPRTAADSPLDDSTRFMESLRPGIGAASSSNRNLAVQYTEMRLWRRLARLNSLTASACDAGEEAEQDGQDAAPDASAKRHKASHGDEGSTESAASFRDFYMNAYTSTMAQDLERIRQEPNFDGRHVSRLIDAIGDGVDVFSDLDSTLSNVADTSLR